MAKATKAKHGRSKARPRNLKKTLPASPKNQSRSSVWAWFASKYPGHPALKGGTVYALPKRLLDAICQVDADFFSDAELEFEHHLSEGSGSGFFARNEFRYGLLPDCEPVVFSKKQQLFKSRNEKSASEIDKLLAKDMKKHVQADLQIEKHSEQQQKVKEEIEKRRKGYAGWLATNPGFRAEVAKLRNTWNEKIKRIGRFPTVPMYAFDVRISPGSRFSRELFGAFIPFYYRWCLESMATWDLPIPLRAQVVGPTLYSLEAMTAAGLVAFVPWFLSRDQHLNLHSLAKFQKREVPSRHLDEWIHRGRKNFGHSRFATMLEYFVFMELGLKCRYPEKLRRKKSFLDQAFAVYAKHSQLSGAESVEKIRKTMNRLLQTPNS